MGKLGDTVRTREDALSKKSSVRSGSGLGVGRGVDVRPGDADCRGALRMAWMNEVEESAVCCGLQSWQVEE